MLRTKNIVTGIEEIPVEWIFEHYLMLPQQLVGQDVKMKSVFNPSEKNPSFYVFYSTVTNMYRFKDFSTGIQGDAITLVQKLYNLNKPSEAIIKITTDYNHYVNQKGKRETPGQYTPSHYKVTAIKVRNWNEYDRNYWMAYHINSKLLEEYCVKPLEHFTLTKKDNSNCFTVKSVCLYGYFRKDGTLYKIYQPLAKDHKFIMVKRYIHGADQLTYQKPYLCICSSLKDALAFLKLGFTNVEVIAPESENTILSLKNITTLKSKYKAICTLLDNDRAGLNAMAKYAEQFGIAGVHLQFEKDLAECVKVHGLVTTKEITKPLLIKALTRTLKTKA